MIGIDSMDIYVGTVFTDKFMLKHVDKLDPKCVIMHQNPNMEYLNEVNRRESFYIISQYPGLPIEFVEQEAKKLKKSDYWEWAHIPYCQDLSLGFINKYINRLDLSVVCKRQDLRRSTDLDSPVTPTNQKKIKRAYKSVFKTDFSPGDSDNMLLRLGTKKVELVLQPDKKHVCIHGYPDRFTKDDMLKYIEKTFGAAKQPREIEKLDSLFAPKKKHNRYLA